MTLEIWLAYVTTILILMSTPGPSHMLMLTNSMTNGFKRSLATAAGDLSANTLQMIIVAAGLVRLVQSSQEVFVAIKWLGVSYLVLTGVLVFRRRLDSSVSSGQSTRSGRTLYLQGFLTSATNPKAIVFFAALFPQFVNTALPTGQQFLILGLTYLLIDGCFLGIYGAFSTWVAGHFQHRIGRHMNQISGVLFVIAAILLGVKEISNA